jgi:hypothetical protein
MTDSRFMSLAFRRGGERSHDETGLKGRKPREVADPCPAYAKAKEHQRHNATGRRGKCAENAARRDQPLYVDCHGCRMHPVVTTGSRDILMLVITALRAEAFVPGADIL